MKILKIADGGAIEKLPLATAAPSSIKHQKKPLKEEERSKEKSDTDTELYGLKRLKTNIYLLLDTYGISC